MTAWSEYALAELGRAGYRRGGARRAVVEYLGRQSCCVSAQELHDGLRSEGAAVGIASVYRVLETLAARELVHRVDLGGNVARFEPALPDGEHHHHLVCDDCGRVETFTDPALERTLSRVAGDRGYALGGHEVVVRGACGACRAA